MNPRPPGSTLFPYTTLFRSLCQRGGRPRVWPAPVRTVRKRRSRDFSSGNGRSVPRSEEHTSELQSPDHHVCRLLLEKKNYQDVTIQKATKRSKVNNLCKTEE